MNILKNMREKIIALVFLGAICATILAILNVNQKADAATSFNGTPNLFFVVGTSTPETITANVIALATSTGRTWARIANTSGVAVTCIYANGAAATLNNGFIIAASSTFEMNQLSEPVYTGAVSCISDGGSAKLYIEANQ